MKQTYSIAPKPHYPLLDGLRGVASLIVIWYHIFEGFATSPIDQSINHGYLAVDFFFLLSGFVIGYAYDDRWQGRLTTAGFFKRRLIRLHPMLVLGAVLGAITFCIQGSQTWTHERVALSMVMLALLMNLFMIPNAPGAGTEVRGNGEMFPLNGPTWSLFFEYVANILYATLLRRLSTKVLATITLASGALLIFYSVGNYSGYGNMGVGWTLAGYNLPGGILRMLFPFTCGLLMARVFRPVKVRGAFWICSLALVALLATPHLGQSRLWLNGLYDGLCITLVFPLIVWLGASGIATDKGTQSVCRFAGNISYPVYIVHYPFMYLYYAWVWDNHLTFASTWPIALLLFFGNIALAYAALKIYDEPLRKWLAKKF